jgi:hypothetical protein
MASPNLSEIVTTTLRNRSGKLADNVTRNNAVLDRLAKRGNAKPFGGGRTIVQEIEYAQNGTYKRYSGYEVLNIAPSDVFTAAEFPIRQAAVAVSISGLEMLQNSGKEAVIDLLESRVKNAERTFTNGLSFDAYSDGTATGQIGGLQALVSTTPTSGTVGGIDRASWVFWQNIKFSSVTDGGAAATSANIQSYMNRLMMQLVRGQDAPDIILADNNYYRLYLESLQAIQRISTDTGNKSAGAGFTSLKYNGVGREIDVVLDGGFQGYSTDTNPSTGGAPTNCMFALNTNYIFWRPHRDRNMVPLDPDRFSVNQDAVVKLMAWAGNMTISNSRLQGVLAA